MTDGGGGGFAFQNCVDILVLVLLILALLLCMLLVNLKFFEDLVRLLAVIVPPLALAGSADTCVRFILSGS